jgi:hypothetical protein
MTLYKNLECQYLSNTWIDFGSVIALFHFMVVMLGFYIFPPWENRNGAAADAAAPPAAAAAAAAATAVAAAAAAAATGSPTAAWISKDTVPHMVGYLKWVRDEFTIILRYWFIYWWKLIPLGRIGFWI